MNTTATNNPSSFNYETSTYVMIILLAISEILPFIKKTQGSGFIHTIITCLRTSECLAKKIADEVENFSNKEPESKDVQV